jgi:hypothetical protein
MVGVADHRVALFLKREPTTYFDLDVDYSKKAGARSTAQK